MEIEDICYHYAYLGYIIKTLEPKKDTEEVKKFWNKEPLAFLREKIIEIKEEHLKDYCSECKAPLKESDNFCGNCGKKILNSSNSK